MRSFLIAFVLVGCGGDGMPAIDAMPDSTPIALDCPTYCAELQANCTGVNAQYLDPAHCMTACALFTVTGSAVTDKSGDTLGCRIFYGGKPSMMQPATSCAIAGPAGDQIKTTSSMSCSGNGVCASFCALEIKACGSLDSPLPNNPRDNTNNPLFQYRNMADCMSSCSAFDKTHEYGTTAMGNSLACRLNYAVKAANSVTPDGAMYCSATAATPTGSCTGTATP